MSMKWIGSMVIIAGCCGIGLSLVSSYRRQVKQIRQFLSALDMIQSELEYRRTPLPELCRLAGQSSTGAVRVVFESLYRELDKQIAPDAACCMNAVLSSVTVSHPVRGLFYYLGKTLGRFDLPGQIRGIDAARREGSLLLDKLTHDQDKRVQSYQTLALCAGAAMSILLF